MPVEMRNTAHILIIALAAVFGCHAAPAGENTGDYDYVVNNLFWNDLYADGGWSFYCGYRFEAGGRTGSGRIIDVEHIYPVSRMLRFVHCRSRLQCFESGNKAFRKMEADMHNLYPAWQAIILYRYEMSYGMVRGENRRFGDCDVEWKSGVLEPRPIARGNIARAYFYMHDRYGLPIRPDMLALLKQWNRSDPPSSQEKYRNNRIEALQGVRNPYIDNPGRTDGITPGTGK